MKQYRASRTIFFGAAVVPLALLSACGGGGGSGPSTISTPAPMPTPTPAPSPAPAPAPVNFDTAEFRGSDGPSQHGALTAYNAGATGNGVILGVIDSGLNVNSSEFVGRIHPDSDDFAGTRGIGDEGGHGSAVTSVAAGSKNGNATHGMAFDTDILVLRTDSPGTCAMPDPNDPDGDGCSHNSGAIAAAINQARISGARVVNISLGGPDISNSVRNAIANAAAAGVVVVVSAGNDGAASPDGFAASIADNGNGHVIIAGSVGTSDNISSFSNRAGSQSANFLAALGERVRADDNDNTAFLWSGTSFSAPQISGAVALLAQAFPNLTGAQIVDILFASARDAGDAGTDAIYGRGVLDIAAAFQPQGQSSLAGSKVAVDLTAPGGQTSAAMGDAALQGQNVGAIILDGFDRAFALDLAHDLKAAVPEYKLTGALSGDSRNMSASSAGMQIAVNIGRTPIGLMGRNNLALSDSNAGKARMLAASVVSQMSPEMKVAFGFRQSSSGLVAQLQDVRAPAFLVSPTPVGQRGFAGQVETALALRREFSGFGLSASAESGSISVDPDDAVLTELTGLDRDRYAYNSLGFAVDRKTGRASLSIAITWLDETDTILGSRFTETIGARGAQSWFADSRAGVDLGTGWRAGASWRQGWTQIGNANLVTGGSLKTSSFAADVSKTGLFSSADHIAFRFAQPMRVSSGGLNLELPVGYSYESRQTEFGQRTLNLAPQGRELVSEMAYATPLWGGLLNTNLFWRQEPGHFEALDDDFGGAVRFQLKF